MTRYTPRTLSDSALARSEALFDRIHASVRATPASTVRTHAKLAVALAAAVVLTAAVLLVASEVVYGRQAVGLQVAAQSSGHLLTVLFMLGALTLVATSVALSRGGNGLGAGAAPLGLVASLVAPVYAWLVLESPVHAHDAVAPAVEISPWGLRCLVIGGIVGVFVLAAFGAALRRAVPSASLLRAAALGATAGAWAGLTVFLFCPSSELRHLLVGHVLPVVAFTLLGAALLPRVLRP